jgi:hypothetical protein
MADVKRLPLSHEDEVLLRDRQIDGLIDEGLDRYFDARYEDAIHVWTRVLFLDRSHARARAYIERARTALAELQRRSDELLQASRELLDRGDTDAARRMLGEAVATTADDLQVSALRVRLERLEQFRALSDPHVSVPVPAPTVARWTWRPSSRWVTSLAGAVLVGTLALMLFQAATLPPDAGSPVAAPSTIRLPRLTGAEVALVRARTAFAGGRLSQALRELERVSPQSPERAAADDLRVEIQQLLFASAGRSPFTPSRESSQR